MCTDLLPEKLLQAIKKKEKLYERNTFVTNFTEGYINSQLLLNNAKIFKSYILISTCELFTI